MTMMFSKMDFQEDLEIYQPFLELTFSKAVEGVLMSFFQNFEKTQPWDSFSTYSCEIAGFHNAYVGKKFKLLTK